MNGDSQTNASNVPPAWVQALDPAPTVAVALDRVIDGVRVEGRWWSQDPESLNLSSGPRELVITLTEDASPQAVARGVTSGLMRRVEHEVAALTAELRQRRLPPPSDHRDDLSRRIRDLPDGPRSRTGDYYGDLLDIYEALAPAFPNAVVTLQQWLEKNGRQVSRDTLNKQLQRARQQREQENHR